MNARPAEPEPNSPDGMAAAVRQRRQRRQHWLQEGEPSVARFVGQIGILGWIIVTPTLIGLFIGRWLDHKFGTGIFWSAPLLLVGRGGRILVRLAMDAQAMMNLHFIRTRSDSVRPQRRCMARYWRAHWRVPLSDAAMERPNAGSWPIAGNWHSRLSSFGSRSLPACLPSSPVISAPCRCFSPPPASWRRGRPSYDLERSRDRIAPRHQDIVHGRTGSYHRTRRGDLGPDGGAGARRLCLPRDR